jgi:hypothetical protein
VAVTSPGSSVEVTPGVAAVAALLPDGAPAAAARRMVELTGTWLARQRSAHTRAAYRRDLLQWLGWCADQGRDPPAGRRGRLGGAPTPRRRARGPPGGRVHHPRRYDRARHRLDGHGAYLLAGRFAAHDIEAT